MVDAELIVETDTKELSRSVEKEPMPGALLLILDTVSVDRVRTDVVILDMTMVEPDKVETEMVLAATVVTNVPNVCTPDESTVKIEPAGAWTPGAL